VCAWLQKRVDPQNGEEVPYADIVKGFELAPDRYVVIEPGELEALEPKKTKTIEIEDFVELSQIDPVYYDHPVLPGPRARGCKALPAAAGGDAQRRARWRSPAS
jgi:DNA end-binding protein Ku